MRQGLLRVGRMALLLGLLLGLPPERVVAGDEAAERAANHLAASREHLEAGRPEEAWASARLASELAPEDIEILRAASAAADAATRPDDALWMAQRALVAARRDGWKSKALKPLIRRIDDLDPLPTNERPDLGLQARLFQEIGASLAKRKLYANAVDLLRRCRGTASEDKAEAALAKLYGKRKAVEALVASGLDVPIVDRDSRQARRMSRQDGEHESWKEAWVVKSRNYTVKTNLPWLLAREIDAAMEQMQRYYVGFFLGKRSGSKSARCTVDVYRTWDEFNENEPGSGGALGFFVPGRNRIVTYDPRSDGGAFEGVFETLFHEASHQFMHTLCTQAVPAWLDEGTASYFEGARLSPTGRVETNYVAEHRLKNLIGTFEADDPSIEKVIRYAEGGSYPAEYYCVGWGIVYFLKNYENEKAERVYEDLYEAIVHTYRSGEKHDPYMRFVETFIDKAGEKDIRTFPDFKRRWQAWIEDLYSVAFGGAEVADRLLARARRQMTFGKEEAAHESYRWALRKKPDHPACLFELAEWTGKRGEDDVALFRYRELARLLDAHFEPSAEIPGLPGVLAKELRTTCAERIQALAPGLAKQEGRVRTAFVERIKTAADRYVEKGYPHTALFVVRAGQRVLGGDETLAAHARALRDATGSDARAWRRVPISDGLRSWWAAGDWEALGKMLTVSTKGRAFAFPRARPPSESYRVEARFRVRPFTSNGFAGLVFGDDGRGVHDVFGVRSGGHLEVNRVIEDLTRREEIGPLDGEADRWVRLAIEIEGTHARFFVDGALVEERTYAREDLAGKAGVYVRAAVGDVEDFRIGG